MIIKLDRYSNTIQILSMTVAPSAVPCFIAVNSIWYMALLSNGRYICLNMTFTIFTGQIFLNSAPINVCMKFSKASYFRNNRPIIIAFAFIVDNPDLFRINLFVK